MNDMMENMNNGECKKELLFALFAGQDKIVAVQTPKEYMVCINGTTGAVNFAEIEMARDNKSWWHYRIYFEGDEQTSFSIIDKSSIFKNEKQQCGYLLTKGNRLLAVTSDADYQKHTDIGWHLLTYSHIASHIQW